MHKYNLRLIELFREKISDSEISKIIYNEYGIKLSPLIIKTKRTPAYIHKVQQSQKQELSEKSAKIIETLKLDQEAPKSAREISELLKKNYSIRVTKKEVNQIIYRNLRNKTEYCRDTFRYTLKSKMPELDFFKPNESNPIEDILKSWGNDEVIPTVQKFFKEKFIIVKTGNEKLDYLIKSIVKDNAITECEETFLKQKARELGMATNLIDLAKKSLYSNNPYLDNLIHIIFEDGIITKEELQFLKEKSEEHNFSKSFVNKRFWTTGISVFWNHLRKIDGFERFILLFYIGQKLKSPLLNQDMWIFTNLNIFSNDSIEEIINTGNLKIEEVLETQIRNQFKIDFKEFFSLAKKEIQLEKIISNTPQDHSNPKGKNNCLEYTELYKMLDREKRRIGSPDANLLVENIKFQIENDLWD